MATGLFSFNIASGMSVSLTLLRSKFKFISATSSSTCLLKRLNMQCSLGFVEDCTNMCMNHGVAQDDMICIKLQSSHFPRSLLSEFGTTFFLHEMEPIELFICRNPMIFPLIVDATMLANSALTSTNGWVNGDVSVN